MDRLEEEEWEKWPLLLRTLLHIHCLETALNLQLARTLGHLLGLLDVLDFVLRHDLTPWFLWAKKQMAQTC